MRLVVSSTYLVSVSILQEDVNGKHLGRMARAGVVRRVELHVSWES